MAAFSLDDLRRARLANQRLAARPGRPEEVVAWMGAVQAQDWNACVWAVAQRSPGSTAADVERGLGEAAFVRTHVLRPTWHLVAPADLRWMLALTAARVNAKLAHAFRATGLDGKLFARSQAVMARALEGGRHLTRTEIAAALRAARIAVPPRRLMFLLFRAEVDALLCSGARRDKQQTYALLEERVPPAAARTREEARAELARRYLASHGPASEKDFAWWSGMTLTEVRAALADVRAEIEPLSVEGRPLWWIPSRATKRLPAAHLLSMYDELLVGYAARDEGATLAHPLVLLDGRVAGSWRRVGGKPAIQLARPASPAARTALERAVRAYERVMNVPV